jgi:small subunit ribosomal protein S3
MGNKVNPVAHRLGVNKGWNSSWFAPKELYSKYLHEDLILRDYVRKALVNAGVDTVQIKRSMNKVSVEVKVARPGVVIGRGGAGIEDLKNNIKKMLKGDVELKVFELKKPETVARLIAENVRAQVERRVVPKYSMMREIETAKNSNACLGIRIWVSGRIKGAEIARTEKFQWGSIPLQTLRADIDYAYITAQVPNAGKHGIKVWVYLGEKTTYSEIN